MNYRNIESFQKMLDQYNWKIKPLPDYPLSKKTSVRVGGPAMFLVSICTFDEVLHLLKLIYTFNIPWFVLGKGSNLLVKESGFPGVVIQLKGDFSKIELRDTILICGAGASNTRISRFARRQSLSGAEFLSGIPGSVGGAVFMNAGAYGYEMKNIVDWVEYVDSKGKIQNQSRDQLGFSYRKTKFSIFNSVILKACLRLQKEEPEAIVRLEKDLLSKRRKSQPIDRHTWGSVFVNPPGFKVARLIESCNLKGKGIGKAKISCKHANFIENIGGATFEDLMATVELAKQAVWKKYKIKLEMEGRIVPSHDL